MDAKRDRDRKNILKEVQERIEKISSNIETLQRDLNFHRRLEQELKREHYNRSSDEESSEKSIEFIPDPKVSAQVNQHKQKQRKQKTDERKEAFQRAKAWHLDRIQNKKR
jgi:hypothetical protein